MHLNKVEVVALKKIIKMYLPEEERHYEENERPHDHIFKEFKTLNKAIEKNTPTIIKY